MDNGQSAFNFFVGQGLSPVQAAGIVGNLQGESGQGLNPTAISKGDGSDGSDSIGIAQWNGARAQGLKDYAASKGVPWTDLNTQLEYLHSELQGPESGAYKGLLAAQTPEQAGQAMLAYERPKDWNKPGAHPERAQYAARAYSAYGGGQPQAAPASPASPANSLLASLPSQSPMFPAQVAPTIQAEAPAPQIPAFQMPQAPPIMYAQRRAPDLSKLQMALSQGPFFFGRNS